ncbi:peptidoglycan-binding protein [Bacillus salitolerans]|uniref:Peptidoglycan-binding protein n=1 Tax=Bacillus salitolerans TaxID=1437434 RepID=A0ABW4LSN2_9BACI
MIIYNCSRLTWILNKLGYNAGAEDGVFGSKTEKRHSAV